MKKLLITFSVLTTLLFSACEDNSDIGLDIQENDDLVNTTLIDTLTLDLSTVLFNETIKTNNSYYLMVGSTSDPVTGVVNAKSYFQIVPQFNRGGAPVDGVVFDSATVQFEVGLDASGTPYAYGDLSQEVQFSLKELSSSLEVRDYSPLEEVSTLSTNVLLNSSFLLNPYSNAVISSRIDDELAARLFNDYIDSTSFTSKFKGFEISTTSAKAIVGFKSYDATSLDNSKTKVVLHFHQASDGTALTTSLLPSPSSLRFNHIKADFSNTKLSALAKSGDFVSEDVTSNVYLKNGVGLAIQIDIPYLSKFITEIGGSAINKAELEIYIESNSTTSYLNEPVDILTLYNGSTTEKKPLYNADGTLNGIKIDKTTSSVVGYNTTSQKYVFPLTSHLQKVSVGENAASNLFIFPFGNSTSVQQSVIQGMNAADPAKRPKLKIYYTK